MTHYNYTSRPQPIDRAHLGPLPSEKDTKERLSEIKTTNESIKSLKTDVAVQSGDEFFFAMNSCYKEGGKVFKKNTLDINDAKKSVKLIDFEIQKTKKMIGQSIAQSKGAHIRFEENDVEKEVLKVEERLSGYLLELKDKRQSIMEFIRGGKK